MNSHQRPVAVKTSLIWFSSPDLRRALSLTRRLHRCLCLKRIYLVRGAGFEPARLLQAIDFKSISATSYDTHGLLFLLYLIYMKFLLTSSKSTKFLMYYHAANKIMSWINGVAKYLAKFHHLQHLRHYI